MQYLGLITITYNLAAVYDYKIDEQNFIQTT